MMPHCRLMKKKQGVANTWKWALEWQKAINITIMVILWKDLGCWHLADKTVKTSICINIKVLDFTYQVLPFFPQEDQECNNLVGLQTHQITDSVHQMQQIGIRFRQFEVVKGWMTRRKKNCSNTPSHVKRKKSNNFFNKSVLLLI